MGKTCKWQHLAVIVFRGDLIDAPQFRHTGLLIQHLDQDRSVLRQWYMHVKGAVGFFQREECDRDPTNSESFAGLVPVATIEVSGSRDNRLRDAMSVMHCIRARERD